MSCRSTLVAFGADRFRTVLEELRKPTGRTAALCEGATGEGRGRLTVCEFTDIGTHRARSTGARSRRAAGGVRRCLMTPMRAPPLPRTMALWLCSIYNTYKGKRRQGQGNDTTSQPKTSRKQGKQKTQKRPRHADQRAGGRHGAANTPGDGVRVYPSGQGIRRRIMQTNSVRREGEGGEDFAHAR